MFRKLIPSGLLICALAFTPASLWAQNAHFLSSSAALSTTDLGDLVVSFREAGLGNGDVTYTASGNATATYACINGGGNHPSASNKATVGGPVSGTVTIPTTKNGSITGMVPVEEPGAGTFSCPGGQTLVIASVSYTDVTLTDVTNWVSVTLGGPFSMTFCDLDTLTKATVKNCAVPDSGDL